METPTLYIGIDVSSTHLDLVPFDKKTTHIPNTTAGINALIKRLNALKQPLFLCCESTGGYEQKLLDAMFDAHITIARVNPERVRHLAKSDGHFAKTDPLDAALITRFAQQKKPAPYRRPSPEILRLKALANRRTQLIDFKTQDNNRLQQTSDPELRTLIRKHLKFLNTQIAALDKALAQLIQSTPRLRALHDRLSPVIGFGPVTLHGLLAHLPELGAYTDKQLTALVGLAPWARDSGASKGKRSLHGGRPHVRKLLYMPALNAVRRNPLLRAFYQRLLQRGAPKKSALVAVMRKLLCLANRLLADPDFKLTPSPSPAKASLKHPPA